MAQEQSAEALEALAARIRGIARNDGDIQDVLRLIFSSVGVKRGPLAAVLATCKAHFEENPGDKPSQRSVSIMQVVSRLSIFEQPEGTAPP